MPILPIEYAAFLRGVNVGGRVIKMAELKACFERVGFGDVRTFLQSGNVIFGSNSSEPAWRLQKVNPSISG